MTKNEFDATAATRGIVAAAKAHNITSAEIREVFPTRPATGADLNAILDWIVDTATRRASA